MSIILLPRDGPRLMLVSNTFFAFYLFLALPFPDAKTSRKKKNCTCYPNYKAAGQHQRRFLYNVMIHSDIQYDCKNFIIEVFYPIYIYLDCLLNYLLVLKLKE